MKKGCWIHPSGAIPVIAVLLLFTSNAAIGGGIINKQNLSSDYMRTLNRNAATDYADIATYNPAGIVKMEEGFYAKLDVKYYEKDYINSVPGYGTLENDEPSLVPALYSVYRKKRWGGFFAFNVPAGGGGLTFPDGNARTVALATGVADAFNDTMAAFGVPSIYFYDQIDAGRLEVKESSVLGYTLGVSYAISDAWSVAVGTRFSSGTREFDGVASISATHALRVGGEQLNSPQTLSVHLEEESSGWAGILGVNFAANEKLNIALTFVSNTQMDYEMDVKQDTTLPDGSSLAEAIGFPDGSKQRIDIPGLLAFGLSYHFTPELKVDTNVTYYLEKDAEIDTFDNEGNSWDLGVSAEYRFNPAWMASLGYLHTKTELADDQQILEPEEPKLDSDSYAGGFVWSANKDLDVTLGIVLSTYDPITDSAGIEYDKWVTSVSAGVQYRFF